MYKKPTKLPNELNQSSNGPSGANADHAGESAGVAPKSAETQAFGLTGAMPAQYNQSRSWRLKARSSSPTSAATTPSPPQSAASTPTRSPRTRSTAARK